MKGSYKQKEKRTKHNACSIDKTITSVVGLYAAAEVDACCFAGAHHDVGRGEVTVHDVCIMERCNALANGRELAIDLIVVWKRHEPVLERLSHDEGHVNARSFVVYVVDARRCYTVFARPQNAARLHVQSLF